MTTGQFSNAHFYGTIVLGIEASFYYCYCVLRKDIIMGKDTNRDRVCQEFCVNRFNKQHRIAA